MFDWRYRDETETFKKTSRDRLETETFETETTTLQDRWRLPSKIFETKSLAIKSAISDKCMPDWDIALIALAGRYDNFSMFSMAASSHIGFCRKWNMTTAKFAADLYVLVYQIWWIDILKGGRVMAIYVFSKWRPAAILNFYRSDIWRYFYFRDAGFSIWAKFCVNMCNSDWIMAINMNFQNGAASILDFVNQFLGPPTTAN